MPGAGVGATGNVAIIRAVAGLEMAISVVVGTGPCPETMELSPSRS